MSTMNGFHTPEVEGHTIQNPKALLHKIEVFRVETFEPVFVRMLSPDFKGIFTHYHRGRSEYCIGEGCRIPTHGVQRVWKGYVAAERLLMMGKKSVYVPCCFELTENLELDMRFIYQRGQLWEIFKSDSTKGKKSPVAGKLHRDEPPGDLRKPFDILPCLRALYHRDEIKLCFSSPLPARVYIEETPAELPEVLRTTEKEMFTGSTVEEAKRRQKAAAEQKKSPSDGAKDRPYQR